MSNYLTSHYRGVYKIMPEIDQNTNDFVMERDGTICDNDCYIPCKNGAKIFYFGHYPDNKIVVWLTAYIPSIKLGKSILSKAIEQGLEIRNIMECDGEILFNFKAKDLETVAESLRPTVRGKGVNPHSKKNLPRSNYQIPSTEMDDYKRTIAQISNGNYLLIDTITDRFLKNILQRDMRKTDKSFDYTKDRTKRCMVRQSKEYIHSMGFWGKYIQYLNKEIKKNV